MIVRLLLYLFLCLLATSAAAEERIIAGLSQHNVSLTTDFAGSELLVHGGIFVDKGDPGPFDVIVAITGPSAPVEVRKKQREFGIWIKGRAVQIDAAPSFYAVASSGTLSETLSNTDDLGYRIGLRHVIRLIDAPKWVQVGEREAYREAVVRIREGEGLYSVLPNSVTFIEDRVFETRIKLPSNLIEGDYRARVFLTRNREVLDVFTDTIEVRRAGLGRFIYRSAQDYPALYGIASILVALIAGWLASAFFRTFFPT